MGYGIKGKKSLLLLQSLGTSISFPHTKTTHLPIPEKRFVVLFYKWKVKWTFLSSYRWNGWKMRSPLTPSKMKTLILGLTTTSSSDRHASPTPAITPAWPPTSWPRGGACQPRWWFMVRPAQRPGMHREGRKQSRGISLFRSRKDFRGHPLLFSLLPLPFGRWEHIPIAITICSYLQYGTSMRQWHFQSLFLKK